MAFVHLHFHSQYSLLESAVKIPDALARAKELAMPALALTDLGNMFGAVDFYLAAKSAGIKPILGCEIYYTSGSRLTKNAVSKKRINVSADEEEANRLYHLVLLAKDADGYRSLCELVTRTYTEGFHHGKPRADRELIEKYSKGLVCLSAGIKGEVGYHCATGRPDRATETARWFQSVFKDDYFLELQENGLPPQSNANSMCVDIGKELGVGLVACADVHYLKKELAPAHEVLMCIGAGRNVDDSRAVRLNPDEFWFKDEATMRSQFHWMPEAVDNAALIAEKCNFQFKLKDEKGNQIYHLPAYLPSQWEDTNSERPPHMQIQSDLAETHRAEVFSADGTFSSENFLRLLSRKGLEDRFAVIAARRASSGPLTEEIKKTYYARLEEEVEMIIRTGFAGYFLVVADFIAYAKSHGIPVGPGRGSGAGSLVAYSLQITDVDPIPFNLLFERFINPERVSMPDFDVDFCQERRGEVIDYVVRKYGRDKVSQIITFGKLLARGVIRDVGRVMSLTYAEVDSLAKLVPEELGITLEEAFAKEPRLRELTDKEPRVAKLFENARALEGLGRHASVHAAGVVITNRPLVEYCPLYVAKDKENETVVQFDKDFAEKIGLVKFDFLGLKTLTVIENAVKYVRETQKIKNVPENQYFTIDAVNYEDPNVYALISSGDTDGVFQLESSGMKDLCMRVQPTNLEDITAICALYRPGPLNSGMVDDYINRKHGRTEVKYELPQLKEVLEETYGVIVYQEQVMRVARVLAGYSLGEADILRRAMGKKKPEEMAKQKDRFVKGCEANQIATATADHIFDLLAKFAEYGFNKSHSAAYGVLSYQTAYLKHYYPAQFLAALMATEMDNTDKITQYIADAKRRGIEVHPPDVNASQKTFSVVPPQGQGTDGVVKTPDVQHENIRFGLEAIKGVGGVAVDAILAERTEKGPFTSFVDFCKRVNLRKVNKKVVECLVSTGAFDSIAEQNRATLLESMQAIMDYASSVQEEASLGQVSMFDQYQATGLKMESDTSHLFTPTPDWPESKRLQMEKQLVGFYVSGHPMEKWWPLVRGFVHGDLEWLNTEFERRKALPLKERGVMVQRESFGPGAYRNEGPRWDVVLCCMVAETREIITKKGTRMAFVELEDARGKLEAICFPEAYEQYGAMLKESIDQCVPLIISGNIGLEEETAKIFFRTIDRVEEYQNKRINGVTIRLNPSQVNPHVLAQLRAVLVRHRGKCAIALEYSGELGGARFRSRHQLPKELYTTPSTQMAHEVNALFGGDVVKFV